MDRRSVLQCIAALALAANALAQPIGDAVYELRMCTVISFLTACVNRRCPGADSSRVQRRRRCPGKLNAVLDRFRFHMLTLFERHGMKNIAYWTVIEPIGSQPSLVYVLGHASHAAASVSWVALEAGPTGKGCGTPPKRTGS
jgi:NIPSNAP